MTEPKNSRLSELELLVDLHVQNARQGPGSRDTTELAIQLAGLTSEVPLQIADIGCGTGAASLVLTDVLNAQIKSVDFLQAFLDVLSQRSQDLGLQDAVEPVNASMDALPFEPESFDVLWSEGAIYNIGFEHGIQLWKPLLKKGGVLAVSEVTWTTNDRPDELQLYWDSAYPEIATASTKIQQLEQCGYRMLGYFTLPEQCWTEHYYNPLAESHRAFLERHSNNPIAKDLIEAERKEQSLYRRFKDFYSYGFYVAQKR